MATLKEILGDKPVMKPPELRRQIWGKRCAIKAIGPQWWIHEGSSGYVHYAFSFEDYTADDWEVVT